MAGVANNPSFAKKVGIDRKVGEEFLKADRKQKTFMAGGRQTQAKINKANTAHGKLDLPFHSVKSNAKGGEMKESKAMVKKEMAFMQKKGAPKSMIKHEKAEAKGMKFAKGGGIESRGKTKGKIIKMAKGGRSC
jgi:hypothetical protein